MSDVPVEGGCLCGAVRYRAPGPVVRVNHCHCSQCRRSTGAVAATWAKLRRDGFELLAGAPAWYRSSDFARRAFCAACGSTLFWQRDGSDGIDVAVGTLDEAGPLAADDQCGVEGRLAGFSLDRDLPVSPLG